MGGFWERTDAEWEARPLENRTGHEQQEQIPISDNRKYSKVDSVCLGTTSK